MYGEDKPIGWIDDGDPNGQGYIIKTEEGIKVYDKEEKSEFLKEVLRLHNWLKAREENVIIASDNESE